MCAVRSPQTQYEAVAWLLLNGSHLLYDYCEPLSQLGYGAAVVEFLVWSIACMEACVNLCTTRHLQWRMQLYCTACYCYETSGQLAAARACLERAAAAVAQLRLEESSDPPIPAATTIALTTAESDLALLRFKYSVIAATSTTTSITASTATSATAASATAASASVVVLTAAAVQSLLTKEVPTKAQQPAALLELLLLCSCGQTGAAPGLLAIKNAAAVVEVLCTALASNSEAATEDEASEEGASPLPLSSKQCALLMRQLWQLSTSSSSSSTTAATAAAAALQLEPRALATIAEDSALSSTASDDLQCELQLHRRLADLQHWQVDAPPVLTSASDVTFSSAQPATTTAAAVAAAVAAAGGSSRGSGSSGAKRSIGGLGGISESANGSSTDAA
eukprot:16493-Heterococcus_DN1.PRE.1